jgi:hypothetical protein
MTLFMLMPSWRLYSQFEREPMIRLVIVSARSCVHRSHGSLVSMGSMGSGWRRIPCCGNLDAWTHSTDFGGWCLTHVAMDKGRGIFGGSALGMPLTVGGLRRDPQSAASSTLRSRVAWFCPSLQNWTSSSPRGLWWAMASLCSSGWLSGCA